MEPQETRGPGRTAQAEVLMRRGPRKDSSGRGLDEERDALPLSAKVLPACVCHMHTEPLASECVSHTPHTDARAFMPEWLGSGSDSTGPSDWPQQGSALCQAALHGPSQLSISSLTPPVGKQRQRQGDGLPSCDHKGTDVLVRQSQSRYPGPPGQWSKVPALQDGAGGGADQGH